MTQKVTKRQQAVLDCIEACIREKGYGPTVREVCQSLGLSSPSTVHVHLKALEDKGFIKRDPLKSRSIALTYPIEEVPSPVTAFAAAYSKLVNVPLVGNVAAGSPILAEENITDTITLPTDIVGDAPSFMLSVRGESMIEAGINDGDYVVVKEQPVANNGDIVVAIIDDGATVKLGLIGPMTGDYANYGTSTRDGAQVAVDEINEAGGVNGCKFVLQTEDSQGDPDSAVSAFGKLMDDGMNVSLGCVLSGEAQSVITAAKNDDLLIVTCTSSAKKCIDDIVFVPEVGKLYYGRVVRLMQFGAFVEIAPGKDGLVHISKLDKKRVEKVEDVVTVGDMIWVKFMEIDEKGRWNLSRKDALLEIEAQQAEAAKER